MRAWWYVHVLPLCVGWMSDSGGCSRRGGARRALKPLRSAARPEEAPTAAAADVMVAEVATTPEFGELSEDVCLVPGEVMVRVEVAPGNARRIYTGVDIQARADTVYRLLTDYEGLEAIVPNLVSNQVLARRHLGARLKQVGAAQVLPGINFRASMILDVRELPRGLDEREIHPWTTPSEGSTYPVQRGLFPRPWATVPSSSSSSSSSSSARAREKQKESKIGDNPPKKNDFGDFSAPSKEEEEDGGGGSYPVGVRDIAMQSVAGEPGDFTLYQGLWRAQPLPSCAAEGEDATRLTFAVEIQPRPWLPVALVESRIARDLVTNLEAVAAEALRREASQRKRKRQVSFNEDDEAAGVVTTTTMTTRPEEDLVADAKSALLGTLDARITSLVGATADAVAAIDRAAERLRQAGALDDQRVFDFETKALKGRWKLRYSSDLARAFAAKAPWETSSSSNKGKRRRRRRRTTTRLPLLQTARSRRANAEASRNMANTSVDGGGRVDVDDDDAERDFFERASSDSDRQSDSFDDNDDRGDDASVSSSSSSPSRTTPATAAILARLASRLALRSVDLEIDERAYDLIVAFKAPGNLPPPAVRVEHLLIAPQRPFAATMVQERIRVEPLGGWSLLPRPALPSKFFRPILDRSNVRAKLSLDVLYADAHLLVTRSDSGDLRVCERLPDGQGTAYARQQQRQQQRRQARVAKTQQNTPNVANVANDPPFIKGLRPWADLVTGVFGRRPGTP